VPIRELGRGTLMSNDVNSFHIGLKLFLEEKLIYVRTLVLRYKKIEVSNKSFERILTPLEIKPSGLGSRIRDVEAFWYKTKIEIIYFVQLFWLYGLPWT